MNDALADDGQPSAWMRFGGVCLALGAVGFFLAWVLMPGVGVTDANEILTRVAAHRERVMLSVLLQLASAALYAPALVAVVLRAHAEKRRALVPAATVLLVGAMGSAADAVFHWLAVEMTAPGIDSAAMLPVMARMQGPALVAVAPLIAAFFIGTWGIVIAAARGGWTTRGSVVLAVIGPVVALLAGAVLPGHGRMVGLSVLACVAGAQILVAVGLAHRPPVTQAWRVGGATAPPLEAS